MQLPYILLHTASFSVAAAAIDHAVGTDNDTVEIVVFAVDSSAAKFAVQSAVELHTLHTAVAFRRSV